MIARKMAASHKFHGISCRTYQKTPEVRFTLEATSDDDIAKMLFYFLMFNHAERYTLYTVKVKRKWRYGFFGKNRRGVHEVVAKV